MAARQVHHKILQQDKFGIKNFYAETLCIKFPGRGTGNEAMYDRERGYSSDPNPPQHGSRVDRDCRRAPRTGCDISGISIAKSISQIIGTLATPRPFYLRALLYRRGIYGYRKIIAPVYRPEAGS